MTDCNCQHHVQLQQRGLGRTGENGRGNVHFVNVEYAAYILIYLGRKNFPQLLAVILHKNVASFR